MAGMTRLSGVAGLACALALLVGGRPVRTLAPVTFVRVPDGGLQPQLAMDAKGTTHVIYFKGDPAHGDLFYTRLGQDGRFAPSIKVNSQAGAAIATGTIRGGHIALGRNGRVHVAWNASTSVRPKGAEGGAVLYTRSTEAGTGFEPERNVVKKASDLDAGTVAADSAGHVYVAWHALAPGGKGEADRRVWVARSTDDGQTFAPEVVASPAAQGACGCCGVGAMGGPDGELHVLFRAAQDNTHRGTYLLTSRDAGATYAATRLQDWNIASCPMSTYALTRSPNGVLAAWETEGQIFWTRIDAKTGAPGAVVGAPGSARNRKHPALASNARGETLLAWTEGTGWSKGGSLAWQIFDANGAPLGEAGHMAGIPAWSLAAAAARADGSFVILY